MLVGAAPMTVTYLRNMNYIARHEVSCSDLRDLAVPDQKGGLLCIPSVLFDTLI